MNASEFKETLKMENKEKFGRWGSERRRDSPDKTKLYTELPPTNSDEVVQHGNALAATGHYPIGTTDCFNVGIAGGCGASCFVYREGRCESPDGIGRDAHDLIALKQETEMDWTPLTERMPNPEEHKRVLIYTCGTDFAGEQVFDVQTETLNEYLYENPEDQPEVCKYATHWAVRPDAAEC